MSFWMGAGHQKDQPLISSLGFSTPPRIVLRGENSWNAVNDPSLLRDEASLKIPKVWGSETFWVDAHVEVWMGVWRGMFRVPVEAPCPFPRTWPCTALSPGCSSVAFLTSFYNKLLSS